MVNVVTQAEKGYLYLDVNKIQLISLQSPKQLDVGGRLLWKKRRHLPEYVVSTLTYAFFFFFEPRNHQKECVRQYLFTRDKKNRKHDRNSLISLLEQRMVHIFLKKIK